ncbi:YcbK family protein [Paracoccus sp. NSM]|uniref:YcbK family protein n=1 Tax=Paracoccus sp. NSM TaxID=3457784 RepID=UPI004035A5AC
MKVSHFSRFPMDQWRWPNFSPRELASKREGELLIDPPSLDKLQALRTRLGRPMVITSAYRSPAHNRAVGGAAGSLHMDGKAFDVVVGNHDPRAFIAAARAAGFTGIGTYPRQGFIHIDTGPARTWGDPFPFTRTGLAPEPAMPPQPENKAPIPVLDAAAAWDVTGGAARSALTWPTIGGLSAIALAAAYFIFGG